MSKVSTNINNYVRVKLTEEGIQIFREDAIRRRSKVPKLIRDSINLEPELDGEGYWREQLWWVMKLFGHHLGLGRAMPFDSEMIIESATVVNDE